MNQLLILLSLVTIGFSATTMTIGKVSQCSCGNAKTQTDCTTTYCTWDSATSACSNKACSTFTVKDDCTGLPDPFGCVWNLKSSKCETFTKCADYSFNVSDAGSCYDLVKCQADVNNFNTTTNVVGCADRSTEAFLSIGDCTKVPYVYCQWLVQSDNKQCLQNTTAKTCEAKTITQCSDYSTAQCNTGACYLNASNVCSPITCSILPQSVCYIFPSIDSKSISFCQWKNNACVDLDVATLTQAECLPATFYSYLWDPTTSKCELCSAVAPISSSFSQNHFYVGVLLIAALMN